MSGDRKWLWYQLTSIPGIGVRTIGKLLEYAGDVEEVLRLSQDQLEQSGICSRKMLREWQQAKQGRDRLRQEYESLERKGIQFLTQEDEDYPMRFRNLPDAPYGLWLMGHLPGEDRYTASIIGSRACSGYGTELAGELGRKLGELGIQVISGMALGIDAAGQWGALRTGGYSLAVLGCGADICYPRENLELYETLRMKGGILSEAPPGTPALPFLFRLRNRLISGLSDCVIVVEAREKSGTQITVSCALEQGREVFAVPGRMTDPLSRGCNQMIAQGANILTDFSDLAEFFHVDAAIMARSAKVPELSEMERLVYNRMTEEPRHFEEFLQETGLPVGELMQTLLSLELKGAVCQQGKNYYRKCIPL